jgi:hypothetical protein
LRRFLPNTTDGFSQSARQRNQVITLTHAVKPFFALGVPRGLLMQLWGAALNGRTSMKDRICRYRCRMSPCAIHTVRCHSQSTAYWRFLNRESRPHLPNFLFQCIIKGCPASEGGSRLCRRRCSVWLHSNRKTERSDCVVGRECWAVPGGGGFAPAPPGFSALVPVPMRGLYQHLVKKGCRSSIPPRSVEAAESALGLLPSMALSSAQLRLIITAAGAGRALPGGSWSMALYLGGKIHVDHESSPPKEATRHE